MNPADYFIDDSMTDEAMAILREIGTEILLPRGSRILNNRIYLLLEGSCCLCLCQPGGEEASLIYFEPGMMLNFVPCITSPRHLHSMARKRMVTRKDFIVKARTDSRCLAVEPDIFLRRLKDSLPLNVLLVRALTENMLNMLGLASNTAMMPAAQRVCRFVSQTASAGAVPTITMAYAEIANHLSVHAITVAKIFKTLKETGIVERKGRTLIIRDMSAIRRIGLGIDILHVSGGKRKHDEDEDE